MPARMKTAQALAVFTALGQEGRFEIFRTLLQYGAEGLRAGEIGQRVGMSPSMITFHTDALLRAGLVKQVRDGRRMIYSADFAVIAELIAFLAERSAPERADSAE